MANLYSNENVALSVVQHLRSMGHDVLTSYEAGNANQRIPDAEVLEYARTQSRILLTNNRRDFIRLHNQGTPHVGILVFTVDSDFLSLAQRINRPLS